MRRVLPFLALAAWTCPAWGQVAPDSDLFLELEARDSEFFERAFNRCDFAYLESAIHPELRFYHDQGGLQDHRAFLDATRNNICGNPERKPIRKVDPESLEVFPLHDDGELYGAIQRGVHHFYLREPGKPDVPTSTARFTHVYVLDDGKWLLKEVLSYDHGDPRSLPPPQKP